MKRERVREKWLELYAQYPNKSSSQIRKNNDGVYAWLKRYNKPSAKISTAIEAVFYFSRIIAERKIIVFQDDFNKKGESLVETFIRRYDGILDDIEVWRYLVGKSIEYDGIEIRREGKECWYKNLYK